jgi:DNA-binding NtrC family response regulator
MKPTNRRVRHSVLLLGGARRSGQTTATQDHHLLRVHPVPRARANILAVAEHLLRQFGGATGKAVPELSEDAALFLAGRQWAIDDLARRLARAVAINRGSLITAIDLGD